MINIQKSYSIHFSPIQSILPSSVHFSYIWSTLVLLGPIGPILSTLVQISHIQSIQCTLVLFSPHWSHFGLFCPFQSYSVDISAIFGPLWSYSVQLCPICSYSIHMSTSVLLCPLILIRSTLFPFCHIMSI